MTSKERIERIGLELLEKRKEYNSKIQYFLGYRQGLLDAKAWIDKSMAEIEEEFRAKEKGETP